MMRARATWMLLGASWVALLVAAACGGSSTSGSPGSDEAGQGTSEAAGAAGQPVGGQPAQDPQSVAGDAGAGAGAPTLIGIAGVGDGGAAGSPGDPVPSVTNQTIGAACVSTANCKPGLTCITETTCWHSTAVRRRTDSAPRRARVTLTARH